MTRFKSLILCAFASCVMAQNRNDPSVWTKEQVAEVSKLGSYLKVCEVLGERDLFSGHEQLIRDELAVIQQRSMGSKIDGITFFPNGAILINTDIYPQYLDIKWALPLFAMEWQDTAFRTRSMSDLYEVGFLPSDVAVLDTLWKSENENLPLDITDASYKELEKSNQIHINRITLERLEAFSDEEYQEFINLQEQATSHASQVIGEQFFMKLSYYSQRAFLSVLYQSTNGMFILHVPATLEMAREKRLEHLKAMKFRQGIDP